MKKLFLLIFLVPLILMPISLATSMNDASSYVTYNVVYTKTANLQAVHNDTNVKGTLTENSNLNVNVISTSLGNGKYNNTVKVTGYTYHQINLNISGILVSSIHNSTINDVISFISNYSIQNAANMLSMLGMLNVTFNRAGNITYGNFTILYNLQFSKDGMTTVMFNGQQYSGYLYSLSGNVTEMTASTSEIHLLSTSNVEGKGILLSNGLLYSASLSGSGYMTLSFMHFKMGGKSSENLVITLTSTNIAGTTSSSSMMSSASISMKSSTTNQAKNQDNVPQAVTSTSDSVSLAKLLVPAGIIVAITGLVVLVRKLF